MYAVLDIIVVFFRTLRIAYFVFRTHRIAYIILCFFKINILKIKLCVAYLLYVYILDLYIFRNNNNKIKFLHIFNSTNNRLNQSACKTMY